MQKRHFLVSMGAGAAALPLGAGAQQAKGLKGPVLLTVTGAVTKTNRGPLDPVLDQMMAKQKLAFDKAHAFDFAALAALPAVTIRPTLEYDKKQHELRGPLLADVLKAAGATGSKLAMRAVDGYAPEIGVADAQKYRFIVATHLDGQPIPLGGLGPLWAVYDADRFADMAAKPVDQRFAQCPWGLYHIDVKA
ncbi:molybdopterin-dependent oxidoreductase [Ramlibacter humi]|uniref:Molybdopterin-dependent oxidoreductase n=1 Tax=Ramlibacter humi TaxID=2530451 RepID=A0A4Z0BHS0_9BURK|nr:molybdopterin-dependent oxidoreductase [Ramlibacter humi]TFY97664.1 molybdopterin-dependent oxidoreductase [Ramlibacter humi]